MHFGKSQTVKKRGHSPMQSLESFVQGDRMPRRIVELTLVCLSVISPGWTQEIKLWNRPVQAHGFVSQGFVKSDTNNWLTMNTNAGSGGMTDMGLNVTSQLSDKLRVGAQVYDRNLGQLGQWHPSLDWALVDYRFKNWCGVRAGKVKTTLGLYNDSQDLDFAHVFALLPQGIYPTDLRDVTIAHSGADLYGNIPLGHHPGDISYTAFAGHRSDSRYSGYPYLLQQWQVFARSVGGLQYGADLRWNTPLTGLVIGASRMNQEITARGQFVSLLNPEAGLAPFDSTTRTYWTNLFYAEYLVRRLRIDAEYRRDYFKIPYVPGIDLQTSVHAWYVAGSYRIHKRVELGSYYSRYNVANYGDGPLAQIVGPTDPSLPQNHIYDKVVAGRVDLNRFCYVKIEGHFMDGYGWDAYPNGFYPQQNANGFQPDTIAVVAKTGFHF